MALPGEIPTSPYPDQSVDCECGTNMPLTTLWSHAGAYIGYFCPECGPHARVSGYYRSDREAQDALKNGSYDR